MFTGDLRGSRMNFSVSRCTSIRFLLKRLFCYSCLHCILLIEVHCRIIIIRLCLQTGVMNAKVIKINFNQFKVEIYKIERGVGVL